MENFKSSGNELSSDSSRISSARSDGNAVRVVPRATFEGVGQADPTSTYVRGANRMSALRKPEEDLSGSEATSEQFRSEASNMNLDRSESEMRPRHLPQTR